MAEATAVAIDWASATVEDGRLSVPLAGERPKGWADELERVIARLAHGGAGWGDISVGKRKLHVEAVQPGSEADLRHFLESAILQANAALGLEPGEPTDDEPSGPDEEMAARFRSFADGA